LRFEKENLDLALRYVYKAKTAPYKELLQRIGVGSTLESRRIQDMLITINSCFQGKAPLSIMNLIKTRDHKYNLKGNKHTFITQGK